MDGSTSAVVHTAVNCSTLRNLENGLCCAGRASIGVIACTGGVANRKAHVLSCRNFNSTLIPLPGAAALIGVGGLALIGRLR